MNPYLLDLASLAEALPAKMDKDERRARLFVAAISNKAVALSAAASGPNSSQPLADARAFAQESGALVAKWALKAKKLSIALLFGDPFKDLRQETREFAAKWNLDPLFRKDMG